MPSFLFEPLVNEALGRLVNDPGNVLQIGIAFNHFGQSRVWRIIAFNAALFALVVIIAPNVIIITFTIPKLTHAMKVAVMFKSQLFQHTCYIFCDEKI
jgi:hypothetical protein